MPAAVRRRLQPAYDTSWRLPDGMPVHHNEAGAEVQPADVRGHDRLILYSAMVLRAASMLRTQMRSVFARGGIVVSTG